MAILIEKDEGTAARRRIPFWVCTSNGTSPDTGVSNDTVLGSVNGSAQFSLGSASAVSAAAGQYYVEPAASAFSTLGHMAVWYDLGGFPMPVQYVDIVNSNPYSSFSNIAAKLYSGVTVGVNAASLASTPAEIATVVWSVASGNYSALSVRVAGIAPATYSGVTVGVNNIAPGTYSGATVGGLDDVSNIPSSAFDFSTDTVIVGDVVASGLSAFFGTNSGQSYAGSVAGSVVKEIADNAGGASLTPGQIANEVWSTASGNFSDLTVRTGWIAPGTYSGVTVGVNNITPATYSGVTVGTSNPSAASSPAQIADAVWDEAMSGHQGSGSFGIVLQSPSAGSRTRGGSTSVITLGSGETATDNLWNGALINFLYDDGTILAGVIDDYTGSDQSVALRDPLALAPSGATYWIVPLASSGNTVNSVVTIHDMVAKTYSGVTVGAGDLAARNYSGVTVGAGNIAPATYSGVTVGVGDIAPGTYSGVTVEAMNVSGVSTGVEIATEVWSTASGNLSALTVRVQPMQYSGLTVGVGDIKPASYSGVTVGAGDIAAGTYSAVSVRLDPIQYSGLTVQTNNIAPKVYSGVSFNVNLMQINGATLTGDGSTVSWGPV